MLQEHKKHKIFIFGCLLWDIICRPIIDPSVGEDNTGIITENPGGVAFNIASGLSDTLNNDSFSIYLVSVTGLSYQTEKQLEKLNDCMIKTNYLLFKGENVDKYVSVETATGEIFSSVNSCNVFSDNESLIYGQYSKILANLKTKNHQSTFIFDGNLSNNFFSKIAKKPELRNFNNYFVPANFKKLHAFSENLLFFSNFSLLLNIKEASALGKRNFDGAVEACRYLSQLFDNKFSSIVVTNGSKIACGVEKKKLFMLKPRKLTKKSSRSGAGDFFFANYIAASLKKPNDSNREKLKYADLRTYKYLNKQI